MHELVTQLGTLIGVVVGVTATFLATSAGSRAQWNREQRARTEDRKLDAYVAYVDTSSRVYDLSMRLARTRGLPTKSGPIALEPGLDQLTQAATERAQSWYRLQLVGDPATVSAGREWLQAVWDVEKFAIGDLNDETKFRESLARARRAQSNFHEIARRGLGIQEAVIDVG